MANPKPLVPKDAEDEVFEQEFNDKLEENIAEAHAGIEGRAIEDDALQGVSTVKQFTNYETNF